MKQLKLNGEIYAGEKVKQAFDKTYPDITPKRDLQGEALLIRDIRQIDSLYGLATVYEAIRESDGQVIAFTGGTVLDKQDLQKGDKITLKLHKGKNSEYWIAEEV